LRPALPDEIVENLALHALDLQPVAGAERGPFLGPRGPAQVLEQALEFRHALPGNGKFLIVADHASGNSLICPGGAAATNSAILAAARRKRGQLVVGRTTIASFRAAGFC